jgi:hypothetical protein
VDAGPDRGPDRADVPGPVHDPGHLVPAAPPRLVVPARRPPRRRARRRRHRGLEEGDLARGKRTAAALGAWIVFDDETGQSLRPPRSRTWSRRGLTPVIRVRGGGSASVSVAGLACYRAGHRTRLIYRIRQYRGPQGRDEGVHLDRVPGPAGRRAPAAARRQHRPGLGQPQRPPQGRTARLHWCPALAAGVPAAVLRPGPEPGRGHLVLTQARPAGQPHPHRPAHLLAVIKTGLKKIQYRPGLIDGCLPEPASASKKRGRHHELKVFAAFSERTPRQTRAVSRGGRWRPVRLR